jgi:hypothetical protein
MKVIVLPEIRTYFDELETILYEKGYFSYEENAHTYVDDLFSEIRENLHTRQHKPAPERYARYGEDLHYASFVKNKRTTWYAFFTKYQNENFEMIYLIRYIGNNHTEAQYL